MAARRIRPARQRRLAFAVTNLSHFEYAEALEALEKFYDAYAEHGLRAKQYAQQKQPQPQLLRAPTTRKTRRQVLRRSKMHRATEPGAWRQALTLEPHLQLKL